MVPSGVSQSHVQPVWAEIPSLSENISAGQRLFAATLAFSFAAIIKNQNPLVNSRLPSPDIQVAMDVNVRAPR